MRLPITALKELAQKYGYSHVIVYAYDSKDRMQHIATYGRTITECDQAAQFGDMMKDALRWPESLHAVPNRVKLLQDMVAQLEEKLRTYEAQEESWQDDYHHSQHMEPSPEVE